MTEHSSHEPEPFPARPSRPKGARNETCEGAPVPIGDEEIGATERRAFGRRRPSEHVIVELELDDIDAGYLIRDRLGFDDEEMESLVRSLGKRGQQTPIEVMELDSAVNPHFGLISGLRRLQALKRISEDGGRPVSVRAILRDPEEASDAYLAMVEENEIRVGLSYYERARVVLKTVEQGVFPDIDTALTSLFHSCSRSKRSKIRSFVTIVEALDGVISFPEATGERLGLALVKAFEEDGGFAERLRQTLGNTLAADSAREQEVIRRQLARHKTLADRASSLSDSRSLGAGLAYTHYDNGDVLLSGSDLRDGLWYELLDWLIARQLE